MEEYESQEEKDDLGGEPTVEGLDDEDLSKCSLSQVLSLSSL